MSEKRKIGPWIESGYLGHGTFGMVRLWYNEHTKQQIALKTCRNEPPLSEKNRERWRQEVQFLNHINHPNIIKTIELPPELAQDELTIGSGLPALCMEYCEGGDLRKTLCTSDNCCGLKEGMIIRVCEDIASAIECLHKAKIAHRDLKPENIVICPGKNRNTYKVIDLGYAKQADPSGVWHSFVGTRYYLAPEILSQKEYTLTVDLWSFGILLYECCTGLRPFPPKFQGLLENKEREFIAVKEEADDMFVCCDKLPEVNRLNCVLRDKFEKLLRLLLDVNPLRRGILTIETETISWQDCIRDIQNTKVVEVFSIDQRKQYVYEITLHLSLSELKHRIEKDTSIPVRDQELFIHDGSDLSTINTINDNLTVFMFNKVFDPKLNILQENDVPSTLADMLNDPDGFSKRSVKCHKEVYKHSIFFIQKQIANTVSLIRGRKALVIRLLQWSREEFTLRCEKVGQKMTELKSVVSFFQQSLHTDLKIYEHKHPAWEKCVKNDLMDFEAWKQVEKKMNVEKIFEEAQKIFQRRNELQAKITTIKNNERGSKTSDSSRQQLNKRANEIQSRYEELKTCVKKVDYNIGSLRETIKMVLKEVEKINEEFYNFLRQLLILRKDLEIFIPDLNNLNEKMNELRQSMQQWQHTRQKQIWDLLSVFSENEEKKEKKDSMSYEKKPANCLKKRLSGADHVKQGEAFLLRMKEKVSDVQSRQKSWKHQLETLDWSFCQIDKFTG
ncbi:inhibitor of nuclear factor kappa-B kinase subunit beta-like isoform X2 [Xenia sp. Carnegie-2017]|uniref:inhibitor of nuclear factor kappa-B kinase subunit beta-like isoform X2 n=1 Tax=Xenia sp. Carnegie-2017 TaxID=2897299 RepID=UPI001F03DB96|nr:inhibitor of nuclear factor kappa-B kinase subunit beta-like isoform X2 [Xenia sp. Carnegie-2017]